jgi:methylglutaconyl-CoA hydratase
VDDPMTEAPCDTTIDRRGVAVITLRRPAVHNAFDERLIAELGDAFARLAEDDRVRVVQLRAEGKSFSAGADLNWMRRMAGNSEAENLADAERLAALMAAIDRCRKPTIAVVQGAALGGGVGLVAACDMALAAETARFGLTEVRLGLIPAVVSPYVVNAIGVRAARRYMLTGERFDAATAHRLGLVHEVVPADALDAAAETLTATLLTCGPNAIAECKTLIARVARGPIDDPMIADTAERIARIRATDEGREGIAAFLEKRKPDWVRG